MPADIDVVLKLEVPLVVQLASRTMSLREVLAMAPGAIIELPKLADDELEVLVNNRPVGLGRAVKVGENFGVKITYVGNLQQRIDAMRDEPEDEAVASAEAAIEALRATADADDGAEDSDTREGEGGPGGDATPAAERAEGEAA